jgi:hypothetical protein
MVSSAFGGAVTGAFGVIFPESIFIPAFAGAVTSSSIDYLNGDINSPGEFIESVSINTISNSIGSAAFKTLNSYVDFGANVIDNQIIAEQFVSNSIGVSYSSFYNDLLNINENRGCYYSTKNYSKSKTTSIKSNSKNLKSCVLSYYNDPKRKMTVLAIRR